MRILIGKQGNSKRNTYNWNSYMKNKRKMERPPKKRFSNLQLKRGKIRRPWWGRASKYQV